MQHAWQYTATRDWRDIALCFGMPSEIFYGDSDKPMTAKQISVARSTCVKCPVRRDCLITALKSDEPHGIWGGFTSTERKNALKRNNNVVYQAVFDYDSGNFTKKARKK